MCYKNQYQACKIRSIQQQLSYTKLWFLSSIEETRKCLCMQKDIELARLYVFYAYLLTPRILYESIETELSISSRTLFWA